MSFREMLAKSIRKLSLKVMLINPGLATLISLNSGKFFMAFTILLAMILLSGSAHLLT